MPSASWMVWGGSDPAVDLAAVGDPQREHDQFGVLDRVDDSVVTDPDTPQIVVTDQSSTPCRSRATSSADTTWLRSPSANLLRHRHG
jgi:hypothetical protein